MNRLVGFAVLENLDVPLRDPGNQGDVVAAVAPGPEGDIGEQRTDDEVDTENRRARHERKSHVECGRAPRSIGMT